MRVLIVAARSIGTLGLAALSALHAVWAAGSSWPAPDRTSLAEVDRRAYRPVAAVLGVALWLAASARPGELSIRPRPSGWTR